MNGDGERFRMSVEDRAGVEATLCQIWAELLGVPLVQTTDDFFELGGYSLLATQITARIRATYRVVVDLETFYEEPTVRSLAGHVIALAESGQIVADEPITAVGDDSFEDLLASIEQMSDEEVRAAMTEHDPLAEESRTDGAAGQDGTKLPADAARRELETPYVAPRTVMEQHLADLWSDALKVEPVGIDDDFFELGGHSLLAGEILQKLQDSFEVEISATTLYLDPTIRELARAIDRARGAGAAIGGDSSCG